MTPTRLPGCSVSYHSPVHRGKWVRISENVFYVAAILIACVPALLIYKYGVNIPLFDDWNVVYDLHVAFERGELLSHLTTQANECRPFFPRLIFLPLAKIFQGDLRAPMYASWVAVCIAAWCLWRLALPLTGRWTAPALFLACALIFSPIQAENWLWGNQLMMFMPLPCLFGALLVLMQSNMQPWTAIACSVGLCTVASFSFANGLLSWFAILAAMLISPIIGQESRWRIRAAAAWAVGFVSNLLLYFWTFHPAPGPQDPLLFIKRPVDGATYFLWFLGSPLANRQPLLAIAVAIFLLLGLAWTAWFFLLSKHRNPQWRTAAPFLIVGSYSILSALLPTSGRLILGVDQAFSSRYTTVGIYGFVALIFLLAGMQSQLPQNRNRWLRTAVVIGSMIVIAGLHIQAFRLGTVILKHNSNAARFARACLALSPIVEGDCKYYSVYADPNIPRTRAPIFERMGLLHPGLFHGTLPDPPTSGKGAGAVNDVTLEKAKVWRVRGWVQFANREAPPDGIVLAVREENDGRLKPAGMGIPQVTEGTYGPYARFESTIERDPQAPAGIIHAYAFRYKTASWTYIGEQRFPVNGR
jgi:hypothetical protein